MSSRRRPFASAVAMALLAVTAASLGAQEPAAPPATVAATPEAVIAHLEQSRATFFAAIAGLSETQWRWKPAPDRWSVAECAEHITRTEAALREFARKAITEPASAETLAKSHGKSATILQVVVDRSQRFQAPEPLNPASLGDVRSRSAIERDFSFERGRSVELAASHPDLEAYAAMSPVANELDLAAWLYFLSGHTLRHTLQIDEVKATPGFPAS